MEESKIWPFIILANGDSHLGVPQSMCLWILDFLLNKPQVVKKIGNNLSGLCSVTNVIFSFYT